jgi:NitT/TauT family transport system substrate-binding protein
VHNKNIREALVKGEVDAGVILARQYPKIKTELASNAVIWPLQKDDEHFYILASRRNLIEKRPETVERFLRAIHVAETFYNKNPTLAVDTISKVSNIRREMLEISLPLMRYELALPMALLIAMEDECRWLIDNRMTDRTKVPNFLDFFNFDGLASVHPDSIGIIH